MRSLSKRSGEALLPDFLIIGAPKCATSWLQSALKQHPRVRIVPDEIEFFSSHVDRPLQWYLNHFKELIKEEAGDVQGKRLVIGEKSAGYCGISASRIRLVRRLLPDARLILMVRDPVKRHWSHAKRYFQKENRNREATLAELRRKMLFEFFKRTRRFSEFSKMIEMWSKVYPPEQLLVINQEDAFADPADIFRRALAISVSARCPR